MDAISWGSLRSDQPESTQHHGGGKGRDQTTANETQINRDAHGSQDCDRVITAEPWTLQLKNGSLSVCKSVNRSIWQQFCAASATAIFV